MYVRKFTCLFIDRIFINFLDKENLSRGHGEDRERDDPRDDLLDLDRALARSR